MSQFTPGQGASIIGLRGKGKTRLIWAILAGLSSWVANDGKHDPAEWAAFGRRAGAVVTSDPQLIRRHPKVVFQVSQLALEDRAGWRKEGSEGYAWTQANMYVLARGNTMEVFDDALEQLPSSGANPHARRNVTQGRSLNVSGLVAAQTGNWLDTRILKQLEHCFVFPQGQTEESLQEVARNRAKDPRPAAEQLGWGGPPEAEKPFHFLYQPEVGHPWVACLPVPKDL